MRDAGRPAAELRAASRRHESRHGRPSSPSRHLSDLLSRHPSDLALASRARIFSRSCGPRAGRALRAAASPDRPPGARVAARGDGRPFTGDVKFAKSLQFTQFTGDPSGRLRVARGSRASRFRDLASRFVDLASRFVDLASRFVNLASKFVDLASRFMDLDARFAGDRSRPCGGRGRRAPLFVAESLLCSSERATTL